MNLIGLPELVVRGLNDLNARALLDSVLRGPVDGPVRDRFVAETCGNPLALLELSLELTPAEIAGGFGLPDARPLSSRIEEGFVRRLQPLPAETRMLLLAAAAEPIGDVTLLWRAADQLGIGTEAASAAEAAGLIEIGTRVRFRHPLVRSASYRSESHRDRQEVHRALASVTDPKLDPDRRAWHLAHATQGPDEDVASELERSADRAQTRGGLAAAAAFLDEATRLTLDPARRTERALVAARAKHEAGAPDAALALLAVVEAGPMDELQGARVDLLRGQIAFVSNPGSDVPPLLLRAAKRLEPLDVGLARETYLDALTAAVLVGRLSRGVDLAEVARAASEAPAPLAAPRGPDFLLDGLARLETQGRAAGTPLLKQAVSAFRNQETSTEEDRRWLWLVGRVAQDLWDDESWEVLCARHVTLARQAGALSVLPIALRSRIFVHSVAGELDEGTVLTEEVKGVTDATGSRLAAYGAVALAAWRGDEAKTSELIRTTIADVVRRGEGMGVGISYFLSALLYNGLGRYAEALSAAETACEYQDLGVLQWALTELIEAASRCGQTGRASAAFQRLSETTAASGTDWALGIEARSRALLGEDDAADRIRTGRQSIGSIAPAPAPSSPGPTSSTANGSGVPEDASMRVSTSELLTPCLPRWEQRRSTSVPGASWLPPVRRCASEPSKHGTSSRPRKLRSPDWPQRGGPTPRSAPNSSSVRERSSGTYARSIPSSASVLAGNFAGCFPSYKNRQGSLSRPVQTSERSSEWTAT